MQVFVGRDAIFATPAMSALIRRRSLYGELFFGVNASTISKSSPLACLLDPLGVPYYQ